MVDVRDLPVVDIHAHPFLNAGALTPEAFTDATAFGGGSREYMEEGGVNFDDGVNAELQRVKRETLYFKRMIIDLAAYFDLSLIHI